MAANATATRPPARLLIVDDHRAFAEALAALLTAHEAVQSVDVAFTLDMARAVLRQSEHDVVLLDLHLDQENGLDLLTDTPAGIPRPPALIVSGVKDIDQIVHSLDAGALGWVAKDSPIATLVAAVDKVRLGRGYLPEDVLLPVLRRLIDDKATAEEPTFVDDLSERELQVLRCLVAGMTRREIAAHLFLSPNTIRTHVQNILRRAEVHSTLALVALARDAGVTPAEPDSGSKFMGEGDHQGHPGWSE